MYQGAGVGKALHASALVVVYYAVCCHHQNRSQSKGGTLKFCHENFSAYVSLLSICTVLLRSLQLIFHVPFPINTGLIQTLWMFLHDLVLPSYPSQTSIMPPYRRQSQVSRTRPHTRTPCCEYETHHLVYSLWSTALIPTRS